ncbi:MAG: TolC family protein [Candidatus Kapabacteria bacterium]|nr:TolC family protein [Candidatus Kapabacteria bacterium]
MITCSVLYAQQQVAGAVRVYTLEECLKIAAGDNLEVQNAIASSLDAAARKRSAFAGYLPNASISLGYSRTLNTVTGFNLGGQVQEIPITNQNLFFASGNIGYTIFDGFARENNNAAALSSQTAADNTLNQTRRRILNTVRSQYITVLRAKQTLRIRREDFEVGKKQVERLRAQYEAGVIAVAPVLTQEADVANRELAIVQAENDLELAKGTLLTTLGMNPSVNADFADIQIPATISENDIKAFRNAIGDLGTAAETATNKRLDIVAAQSSVEAAQSSVKAAQASWLPTLSAGYQYNWNGNALSGFEYGRQGLGLSLDYTIFNGFQRDVSIQRAQIVEQQAMIQKRQAEQRINADVQNAFIQLTAAEKSLDITARAIKAAQQNFDAAEERFKVGAANILDYTTANGNLATAKINRANAIYNYIAAQYQMRFALGLLEE